MESVHGPLESFFFSRLFFFFFFFFFFRAGVMLKARLASPTLDGNDLAVGQHQWYHFGVGAPPILVYFSGVWDVHWGYGVLTHSHFVFPWFGPGVLTQITDSMVAPSEQVPPVRALFISQCPWKNNHLARGQNPGYPPASIPIPTKID